MDILQYILLGVQVVSEPINLLYCFLGAFIGTLVGVLPGLGPVGAMSVLLPATFKLPPIGAIIMLAGIYYGCQYGGSITSILVNIPGEVSTIVTCLDGYQMARKGRAGPALGISAMGSFIGGTIAIFGLMFVAFPLANAALKFGPPENFAIMCMGLVILTFLGAGSMYKSLMMALLGLLLSFVGLDMFTAQPRFSFGFIRLLDGLGLIPMAMGIFGIAEILSNLEGTSTEQEIYETKIKGLLPTVQDWIAVKWAILRGTVIGFFLGIIPGAGPVLSSFSSYAVEKKVSRHPEEFGTGVIAGVAGPETANNAGCQSAFIPLLSLGIPPTPTLALLFGGFLIHGIQPGPLLIRNHPDLFWGVIISMYIGNIMLLILNLPLIGIWVRVLKIPYYLLFPMILLICLIGVYSVNNSVFDIYLMIIFGIAGYSMKKLGFEPAPLALAYVIGPMLENALRQSLTMSDGNFGIFFTRPISAVCMAAVAILLGLQISSYFKSRKKGPSLKA